MPPTATDDRWRTLRFDDSGLRPHDSVVATLRASDDLFLQPNTSTDVHFTLQVPPTVVDAAPGVDIQSVQGFDTGGRRLVVSTCTGEWGAGDTRRCDTPCTTIGNVSMCYSTGSVFPGRCEESCFPRMLPRVRIEREMGSFFVGTEFQLRALTVGYQLRTVDRTRVATEADTRCVSSNVDTGDEVSPPSLPLSLTRARIFPVCTCL